MREHGAMQDTKAAQWSMTRAINIYTYYVCKWTAIIVTILWLWSFITIIMIILNNNYHKIGTLRMQF